MVLLLEDLWGLNQVAGTSGTTGTTGTTGSSTTGVVTTYQYLKRNWGDITSDIAPCVPYVDRDVSVRFRREDL